MISCSDGAPPNVDITDFYQTGDVGSFEQYILKDHRDARLQISKALAKYIDFKINNYIREPDSYDSLLAWLTENYKQCSGITDFSRQYALYKSWNLNEFIKKKYLDSLLGIYIEDLRTGQKRIFSIDSIAIAYNAIGDSIKLSYISYIRGYDFYNKRHIDLALYYLDNAIRIGSLWDNLEIIARSDLVMGKIHNIHLGDFNKSVTFYKDAARCFNKLGMTAMARFAHWGLAIDYLKIFNGYKAIRQLKSALAIADSINDTLGIAFSLNTIGEAYYDLDILDSAAEFTKKSLKIKNIYLKSHREILPEVGYSLSTLGLIKHAQKEYDQSRDFFGQADSIFIDYGDSTGHYMNQLRLASLYLDRNNYDSASVIYQEILKNINKYEETLAGMFGLAICNYYNGQQSQAMANLRYCIGLFENSRSKLPTPELKTGLLSDKVGFYQLLSKAFVDQYNLGNQSSFLDSAFKYIEKSKAIAFAELLSSGKEVPLESRNAYLQKISSLYRALILGQGVKSDIINQIEAAEDSLFGLEYITPVRNIEAQTEPINLKYSREHLIDESQVILEYSLSSYGSFCLVISRDLNEAFPVSADFESLIGKIRLLIEQINKYPQQRSSEDSFKTISRELYSVLIPAKLISHYNNIIIIPSGPLNYLPFEVLLDAGDKYLIESKAISYALSANSLNIIMDRKKNAKQYSKILAFGDPLIDLNKADKVEGNSEYAARDFTIYDDWDITPIPATRSEVEEIENVFGSDKVDTYLSAGATESNFKSQAGKDYAYIHLASHGISDIYNPQRSAMVFSIGNEQTEDGLLHPDEIYNINLKCDLVFLSACKTGTGKYMPGEGVMNLARPFLIAGSNSTIVTSWNINDKSTSDFVGVFYRRLQSGDSKANALMFAKKYFIENQRELYRHPYFWAPFILIGDWK